MENDKRPKSKIWIIIGAVAVIVILAMSVVVFNSKGSSDNSLGKIKTEGEEEGDLLSTDAFFLRDNNSGCYALFNADGKQLTDFIFLNGGELYNNVRAVEDKDSRKNAIIKSNGKYLAEFGKFQRIYQVGSLFKILDGDNNEYIINSRGKQIFKGEGYYINECVENTPSKYYICAVSKDDHIYIVDSEGNILDDLKRSSDDDKIYDIDSDEEYGIVIYDSKAYVYDLAEKKLLFRIDGDEKPNRATDFFEYVSKKNNTFVIKPFDKKYYIYKDGKCMFTLTDNDTEGYFSIFEDGIACHTGDSSKYYSVYDYSGNLITNKAVQVASASNYVVLDDSNVLKFYKDGNVIKEIKIEHEDDINIEHLDDVLELDGIYYRLDGSKINEEEYYIPREFDSNGHAIVEDSHEMKFLIDKNNKKISDEYSYIKTSISYNSDKDKVEYYVAQKGEYMYLLSPEGKELVSDVAKNINVYNGYATLQYDEGVIKIYHFKFNKIVLELNENISNILIKEYYAEVTKDGHTSYYSYTTGKQFYAQ